MRRPGFRWTVRRTMIAVAVMAVLVWSSIVAWRWFDYRRLAIHHENVRETLDGEILSLREQIEEAKSKGSPLPAGIEGQITERHKAIADQKRLADAYRQGMSQPWRKVRVRMPE